MVAPGPLAELLRPALTGSVAYTALADALRGQILDGRLLVGQPVPSERALADALGVSRTTVTAAYTTLRGGGFLTSRRGSGTVAVIPSTGDVQRPDDTAHVALDLTIAALPAPAALTALTATAMKNLPDLFAGHGLHPLGLPALREAIASRYTARGLTTVADQILVTQGALHAWNLALRTFTRPGETVLVEQPTYPAVVDAARAHRLRALPMGVDADGWHVPRTARPPVLAHVIPDHQNPTGLVATRTARRALSAALPGTVLVVDETFAELTLDGPPPPPGPRGLLVGSLSKSVWAGLRVGWIRANRATVARLATSRTSQDQATPVLDQLVAAEVVRALDAILPERLALLRRRRDHLLAELARHRPDWRPNRPRGGMVLWVELGALSSTRLAAAARHEGVRLSPGTRFCVTGTHDRYLRLPFTLPEPGLTEAVMGLARAADAPARTDRAPGNTWTA